jgi:hypothetical protein
MNHSQKMQVYPSPTGFKVICDSSKHVELASKLAAHYDCQLIVKLASYIDPLTPLVLADYRLLRSPREWPLFYLKWTFPNKFVVAWQVLKKGTLEPRYVGPFPTKELAERYERELLGKWLEDPNTVLK